MPQSFFELEYKPYEEKYGRACVDAFSSNVPDFFMPHEVEEFSFWLRELETKRTESNKYYVVLNGSKLVASGGFGTYEERKQVVLAWGFVHREFHRKGIGSALFDFRIEEIKKLYPGYSIILDTSQFSFPFFKKKGFMVDKITPNYYGKGMDRYDMSLKIE